MYTATFKLEQDEHGMVTPSVAFDPKVNPTDESAPAIYDYMAQVAMDFLRQVDLVDENGDWASDEASAMISLDLSTQGKRPH